MKGDWKVTADVAVFVQYSQGRMALGQLGDRFVKNFCQCIDQILVHGFIDAEKAFDSKGFYLVVLSGVGS